MKRVTFKYAQDFADDVSNEEAVKQLLEAMLQEDHNDDNFEFENVEPEATLEDIEQASKVDEPVLDPNEREPAGQLISFVGGAAGRTI